MACSRNSHCVPYNRFISWAVPLLGLFNPGRNGRTLQDSWWPSLPHSHLIQIDDWQTIIFTCKKKGGAWSSFLEAGHKLEHHSIWSSLRSIGSSTIIALSDNEKTALHLDSAPGPLFPSQHQATKRNKGPSLPSTGHVWDYFRVRRESADVLKLLHCTRVKKHILNTAKINSSLYW